MQPDLKFSHWAPLWKVVNIRWIPDTSEGDYLSVKQSTVDAVEISMQKSWLQWVAAGDQWYLNKLEWSAASFIKENLPYHGLECLGIFYFFES